ncbi:MAG: glycosyltransferase [Alphaproteobacteria bacterium]|nr:glycosyltransferase [Alphaproteobacteria bacterium]
MARQSEPREAAAVAGDVAAAALRIAVLIPCFNEEITIGKVVRDFQQALPAARIYVYDNNSTDRSAAIARAAGAVVRREAQQGKGYVVRRMFADIDADIYVLVDGDDTYDAAAAPCLVATLLDEPCDIVNAVRVGAAAAAYRRGHRLGNRLLTGLVSHTFDRTTDDMLSGYRVFSRRFVKSFPAMSGGFEIETELTVHAFELGMPVAEIRTDYKERPAGSSSKLSTYRDGLRILTTIVILLKEERPFQFFAILGAALAIVGFTLGMPVVFEFLRTGLVPRLPTALLATALVLLSFLSLTCGLILDTVTRGRREMKRLRYLQLSPTVRPEPGAGK